MRTVNGCWSLGLDSSTLMPNSHQEPFSRLFNDTFPLPLEAVSFLFLCHACRRLCSRSGVNPVWRSDRLRSDIFQIKVSWMVSIMPVTHYLAAGVSNLHSTPK